LLHTVEFQNVQNLILGQIFAGTLQQQRSPWFPPQNVYRNSVPGRSGTTKLTVTTPLVIQHQAHYS